ADEQEVVQAFLDEARVWALLTHPNIVPLYDCVQIEGRLCLVMEYVEGADLRELIQRASELHRPIPGPIAVQLVAQAAAGLHAAHEARGLDGTPLGIVHRDVSPHNVLVDRLGNARLCDFGIARSALRHTRTRTGKFKGKFAYVSPEVIRGEVVDRRADVFGLGVLLYELLALRRPFQADAPVALLHTILDTEPTPIREVRRDASVRLAHAIERALAKEPAARFATAEAMRQALLETPEGQTFLGVHRLNDWFDGLTGASGDWNVTNPRMLDLAARSAARALEGEEEEEGGTSEASARALAGPWGDAPDELTEPAHELKVPAARPPPPVQELRTEPIPSRRLDEAPRPKLRDTLRNPSPPALAGLFDSAEPSITEPTSIKPPPDLPGPFRSAPSTERPTGPPTGLRDRLPGPAIVREYLPWIAGGLFAGSTLTWILWRLL
ncbi:MAG: serine/threonine-protein kinase, partial [Deltaproteobacteria bacterium]